MKPVLLLAILALAPTAVAAVPAFCGAECLIIASVAGYDPAIAVVPDGGIVEWLSPDITHVQSEVKLGGAESCFNVHHVVGERTEPIRFDIAGTSLLATVGGETLACTGAVGSPAGFALHYYCVLHPSMRGTLVIQP